MTEFFFATRTRQSTVARQREREAVRVVRDLRQEVGRPQLSVQAQEDPQRRQAAQVPLLHQEVHPEVNHSTLLLKFVAVKYSAWSSLVEEEMKARIGPSSKVLLIFNTKIVKYFRMATSELV